MKGHERLQIGVVQHAALFLPHLGGGQKAQRTGFESGAQSGNLRVAEEEKI